MSIRTQNEKGGALAALFVRRPILAFVLMVAAGLLWTALFARRRGLLL